jgi:hypothetical protein
MHPYFHSNYLSLFSSFHLFRPIVQASVPAEKEHLMTLDTPDPQIFGAEYGGFIEDYLQQIVENRQNQNYLLRQFQSDELKAMEAEIPEHEMEAYQLNFMELDTGCQGFLDIDAVSSLLITSQFSPTKITLPPFVMHELMPIFFYTNDTNFPTQNQQLKVLLFLSGEKLDDWEIDVSND